MIFIVGTNETKIKSGTVNAVTCPSCKAVSTFNYTIFSEYAHLTLIPLFPVKKRAEIYCCHCENVIDFNDLSDEDLQKFSTENDNLKNPIRLFLGSIILVLCGLYFGYQYYKSSDATSKLISDLKNYDVIYIKKSSGYYTTQRVNQVTDDSIFTTANDYEAYLSNEIDDINKTENYTNNNLKYSKDAILKMYQNDEIISVKRN